MGEKNLKVNDASTPAKRPRGGGMARLARTEKIQGWLFVAPFIILMLIFFLGPMLAAFMISFKQYSFLDAGTMFDAKWVGLKNYVNVLKDPSFIKALKNTAIYSIGVVPIQLIIALGLALIVDGKIKGKTFFRTAYYIPTQTSTVAVAVMFMFLFKTDGLINKFTALFGIKPYNFFANPATALPSIMGMAIWSSIGLYMVIFLTGLQDIPESLYEAAAIDGATRSQSFWSITMPMLKPTIFFNSVVSFIGCLQMFDQSYVVSGGNGGPVDSTMTVVLKVYNTGFKDFEMGKASAMAFILFIIIFALTIFQRKVFGEETTM